MTLSCDSSYTDGQYPSHRKLTFADGSVDWFAENGVLLAAVDRFGNKTAYTYTESGDRILLAAVEDDAARRITVIDHHRRAVDYIANAALNYHEPYASSAAELTAELMQYIIEPTDLLRTEAEALLAGIVLDTKNFTLRTGGRTFEAAAFLRRCGGDTSEVHKLFQNNLTDMVHKFEIIKNATLCHDCVVVAASNLPVNRIIAAQAADELINVQGIKASFVLFSEEDKGIISGRSGSDINVQAILETLGGGGNGAAAGAQLSNSTVEAAYTRLMVAIDNYFSDQPEAI